jgi:hypothetical protein
MQLKLFLLLVIIYLAIIFLSRSLLISESLYFNAFAEQLSYEQIATVIENNKKWQWLAYIIIPIIIVLRFK